MRCVQYNEEIDVNSPNEINKQTGNMSYNTPSKQREDGEVEEKAKIDMLGSRESGAPNWLGGVWMFDVYFGDASPSSISIQRQHRPSHARHGAISWTFIYCSS